ncbi:cell wall-binding repeat-containing protein [Clostridium gasigenes]|uniref:cell wall-binding repeat-containing protein n=1 Tax=Clostridium gasigenes TaxID=94869 RepID=UPI001C0CE323|nr:cell wall-binding repeat-containing protein [Clostridium gasigenes]MBU3137152.1 cell wall-binding repeat-containing protein [Clostridium gasigenes]
MKNNFLKCLLSTVLLFGISTSSAHALTLDYIAGSDRYETASMIASKMQYSSAILVNGLSIVDGLSASGLSGALNAPILLTEKNKIPSSTLAKLQSVNTIYIVGGPTVVSSEIENTLRNMGKSIVRLGGLDRYLTSITVANQIETLKGVQEIYYVNGARGEADAMSISPVAAKTGNPVILTDGSSTSYKKNVQAYSIGGFQVLDRSFDNFAQRITGIDRFETNKNVINKFFPNKTHVNLSKSDVLIDALTASALKEPVVLISNTSNKTAIAGAQSATVFGNINKIAVNRAKGYIYGEKVVFYSQHQDDETLFAGSAIVDAIESVGSENVHIVLITDGSGSEVFNWPKYINYPISEKVALRNNEFNASLSKLGVNLNNVIYLNQPENNINYDSLRQTVNYFETTYSNVTHVAHSYKYDTHPQHLTSGQLIYSLYNDGVIKDCRFFTTSEDVSRLNTDFLIESVCDTNLEKQRVLSAAFEYSLDNKDMVREGIGYKSVERLFNILTNDPNVTSYLHEPETR